MRILQIDAGRQMRGGQWQVLRWLDGLRAQGVETWLAARPSAPLYGMARERGLRVEPLTWAAVREPADLVHAHDARSHAWAVALAHAPVIVSRRVAFPIGTGLVSRWKYQRAEHFVAVSEYVRQEMLRSGIPAEKVSVVYDGVPLLPESRRTGPVLGPPSSPDKPAEWYLALGTEICLATNLADELKTASLFVYLSESEGLGSAVLLAMAAGVPVIASATGGIREIVRHEENGLLVDRAPAAVAAAIQRLQHDRDLANVLAARGRRTVAEMFSIDSMVRGTVDVYNRIRSCWKR
jgi:hypothetical protein